MSDDINTFEISLNFVFSKCGGDESDCYNRDATIKRVQKMIKDIICTNIPKDHLISLVVGISPILNSGDIPD